ncbi:calcium-binding protein [Sphingomonas sp. CFBP8993]|uniref:calcium-binding protein n=1 Tax=Sphingomonas sp. CFBP8993 TaxID=3096526 RepID=UPI002A6B373E|nr:calcium-binding protein [Sphingomonas sp. CFBP8993]MDY0960277.1 calcium-binding protein [Sphingomonas sp. CFBP8993]
MVNVDGTAGNDVLTGTDDDDIINGLAGDDVIDGKFGVDILNGGSGNDKFVFSGVRSSTIEGKVGLIDGGEGFDTIDWSNISPVTLGTIRNDAGGYVLGAYVGSQKIELRNVEYIKFGDSQNSVNMPFETRGLIIDIGGGNDTAFISAGNDIYAQSGDDYVFISGSFGGGPLSGLADGGSGTDTLVANIEFYVDMVAGTAKSGNASYKISNFEILQMSLSGYASTGLGDDRANIMKINSATTDDGRAGVTFDGRGGNDYISGGAGNDVLRGGDGIDTVSYEYAKGAVRVDLSVGLATGGAGRDVLSGFEIVVGSAYGDTIVGDAGRNTLSGGAGDDTIMTVGGFAAIRTGDGFDRADGGSGSDTLILGGVQSDYRLLSSGARTVFVTARGAVEVTGMEQVGFFNAPAQSWSGALSSTAAFDGLSYIAGYADLRAAFGTDAAKGTAHFLNWGFDEGRSLTFNALDYIASHRDLIKAYGADAGAGAKHFIEWGAAEGRGTTFNGWAYLASHGDLIRAYGANEGAAAKHFIEWGASEGRGTTFDAAAYAAAHRDLAAAFGNDAEALARHYVLYGYAEGRSLGSSAASRSLAEASGVTVESDVPAEDLGGLQPSAHDALPDAFAAAHTDVSPFIGRDWAGITDIAINPDNLVIA